MKTILSAIIILSGLSCLAQQNSTFEKPFRLKANGEYIDITNHTYPCIYDFNKDGKDDLIVGDFGSEYCPGVDTTEAHAYVQARCRIFLNNGTNTRPVYGQGQFLMSDGAPAYVPNT